MSHERILIVDDEFIIGGAIASRLGALDYVVVGQATSVSEALHMAKNLRPDLILMDINLHDRVDGVDLATVISKTLNIPIIFLTAYSDPKTLERAAKSLPYGYIVKPFTDAVLRSSIEIALSRYRHDYDKRKGEDADVWKD